jgi:hypothetical protein
MNFPISRSFIEDTLKRNCTELKNMGFTSKEKNRVLPQAMARGLITDCIPCSSVAEANRLQFNTGFYFKKATFKSFTVCCFPSSE